MDEINPAVPNNQQLPGERLPPIPAHSLRELVRNPLNFFSSITRQYGDTVCYRPAPDTAYLINHPDDVRRVLVDNNRNYSKATYSNQAFQKIAGDGLLTTEGEIWRKQRRQMQPAFHHTRLEKLDALIVGAAHNMLHNWQDLHRNGQPVNVSSQMAELTLTVTARALFGVDLGERVTALGEVVNRGIAYLEKPSHPAIRQAGVEIRAVVEEIIQERRRDFRDTGDLLSSLLLAQLENDSQGMTDEELRNQLFGLLVAGYETTANALSWTWYLLSQNPLAFERLRSEVRQTLNGSAPTYADLEKMPYLGMVFHESLRVYPPAWMIGRRALGEDTLGGYYVAPGTVLAICTYTLHRHPAYWENPDLFIPERFTPSLAAQQHKYAYIPFGAGPRQCIGNSFGTLEACLILACVVQQFELRLVPGIEIQPQALFVLRPNRSLMMSLHA
jgi:cytochrome P450